MGREAERRRGQQVRVTYHERQADGFHNVYLDAIQPAPERPDGPAEPADQGHPEPEVAPADPEAVAWNTAIEAAPWLAGPAKPEEWEDPREFYERLRPFKELVDRDVRRREQEHLRKD